MDLRERPDYSGREKKNIIVRRRALISTEFEGFALPNFSHVSTRSRKSKSAEGERKTQAYKEADEGRQPEERTDKQIPWFITIGDPNPGNDGVQVERRPIDMCGAMTIGSR